MNTFSTEIVLPGNGVSRILRSKVLQSPLAGVTDYIFRNQIREWAPESLLFTEMINANSLELGYGVDKLISISEEQGPTGVQLFDYRPEAMANAAKRAEAAGAFVIDINMGCPVKKIAQKGGGSGLLKEPRLAAEIVQKVANAVKIPVTVKTRLGWCNKTANTVEFALLMQEAGAQLLTLHGRTREELFSGKANWKAIKEVKEALSIPVIANGDIKTPDDAKSCLSSTGADGVMIGRGSMGAPWLIGQIESALNEGPAIETPGTKKRLEIARDQLLALVKSKGDHGLLIARKHLNWTCKGFDGASDLRVLLMKASTPKEAENILDRAILKFNDI